MKDFKKSTNIVKEDRITLKKIAILKRIVL